MRAIAVAAAGIVALAGAAIAFAAVNDHGATPAVRFVQSPSAQASIASADLVFRGNTFARFSEINALDGTLRLLRGQGLHGVDVAQATYAGNGQNGYARTVENIDWQPGVDVWFGGAFFLPGGYLESVRGGNDIMRWDNFGRYAESADYLAIENWSDSRTRLILGKYTDDPGIVLGQSFKLPEGRWFWIEVHQRLATNSSAVSDVYVDGKLVSHSTKASYFGRPPDRIRWGIVAIDAGTQSVPLSLEFARGTITREEFGPSHGLAR